MKSKIKNLIIKLKQIVIFFHFNTIQIVILLSILKQLWAKLIKLLCSINYLENFHDWQVMKYWSTPSIKLCLGNTSNWNITMTQDWFYYNTSVSIKKYKNVPIVKNPKLEMKNIARNDSGKIVKRILSITYKFYNYLGLITLNINNKISPVSKLWKLYSICLILVTIVTEICFYAGLTWDRLYYTPKHMLKFLVSTLFYLAIFCGSISSWIISISSEKELTKMVRNYNKIERNIKSKTIINKIIFNVLSIHVIFIIIFTSYFVCGYLWISQNLLIYWIYMRIIALDVMIIKFIGESVINAFFLQDIINTISHDLEQNNSSKKPKVVRRLDLVSIFDSYSRICCNIQISRKLIIWPVSIWVKIYNKF